MPNSCVTCYGQAPSSAPRRIGPLSLAAILVLSIARVAAAAPGPSGPELGAENRPVPPFGWWTTCIDASGARSTIVSDCSGGCEGPGDLFIERTDADGDPIGKRVRVNEEPAARVLFRITCSASGDLVAQWRNPGYGCYLHRIFDPQGQAASDPVQTLPETDDCRIRPAVAVEDGGGFVAAWAQATLEGESRVMVARFASDGDQVLPGVRVNESALGWSRKPKLAVDENGIALVTWLGPPDENGTEAVFARVVDASNRPVGDQLQLNTFAHGTNQEPAAATVGAGEFEVVWANPLEGGRVARRVSLDPSSPPPVPNVAAPPRLPRFGAARLLDRVHMEGASILGGLTAGADRTWALSENVRNVLGTTDDGASWNVFAPSTLDTRYTELGIGSDAESTWVRLFVGEYDAADVRFSRSQDGGASWSEPQTLVKAGTISCQGCWVPRGAVRGAANGVWIAAWTMREYRDSDLVERVYALRSKDGGKTWSSPVKVASAGIGENGLALETDGEGAWVMLWRDDDLVFSRSTDDGRSWSSPRTLAEGIRCAECATRNLHDRIALAHDDDGRWVGLFSSGSYETARLGFDGDLFFVRSEDGGASWTRPAPIADYASSDGSRELEPALAVDDSGRWIAAWRSYRPTRNGDELDADIVVSLSRDGGENWSAPVGLAPAAGRDAIAAVSPVIEAHGATWMVAWQSRLGVPDVYGVLADEVLVAAADATCGNAALEAGEGCDDANLVDGDGCDSNCSEPACGNGVVAGEETCDEGVEQDTSRCVACRLPVCGDGVVHQGYEECDDGNTVENDGCSSECRFPSCGDGVVGRGEECDTGYHGLGPCTSKCTVARCGDGEIWVGLEACDDGNDVDDDECPNDCSRAVCGDGYTSVGFEECDSADPLYRDICSADCLLVGVCGDANGDGAVTANDARQILSAAVGADISCPRAACDMNASETITAGDARMDLSKAVGLTVGERCSIGTGNIVFWMVYPGEIGAYQVAIEYGSTGGEFLGSADMVQCELLVPSLPSPYDGAPGVLASFNDDEQRKTLRAGIIALQAVNGPVDLFRCKFLLPEDRTGVRFVVRPEDATTPDLSPIVPMPGLGYRVE